MTAGLMGGNKGYKKQGWKGMSEDFFLLRAEKYGEVKGSNMVRFE